MSGGIFVDRPFNPNVKCIWFALLAVLVYAALPRGPHGEPNMLIAALLAIVSYVLLAWYDHTYSCSDYMFSGAGPSPHFGAIFKPQCRGGDAAPGKPCATEAPPAPRLPADEQERAFLRKVYTFHVLVVAPLLLYVAAKGGKADPRVWGLVGGFGALVAVYHGGRLVHPRV